MKRTTRAVLIAAVILAVVGGCLSIVLRPAPQSTDAAVSSGTQCGQPRQRQHYVGVITGGKPGGRNLARFVRSTGVRPDLVAYFSAFGTPWNPAPACRILHSGALPVVQINPRRISLAAIANGKWNSYLTDYAYSIATFGAPVAISFGHEMNGSWYSWGYQRTKPKVFVAAWRHIVKIFRKCGADNVIWLWTVNIIHQPDIPSPSPWWPGASYVNWVGIDGYYLKKS